MAIEQELTVAVMGATGTGKSTFVNLASGSNFQVGEGLKSCTPVVQISEPFVLSGRRMRLIDTPGFDDTTKSDSEVLRMIADFLADSYRQNKKLSGIIYMHRISDTRMTGVSKRNFGMFRSLCGEKTLRNVLLVTNMWGEVQQSVGEARERELATDDILFKPVLDKGAHMVRNMHTVQSAHEILQRFVDNPPEALAIQKEIVDEGRAVNNTTAGVDLRKDMDLEIEEAKRKQEEELRRVREAMEAEARAQEKRRVEEMERARREMEEKMRRAQEAHAREMARQAEERQRQEKARIELERVRQQQLEAQRRVEEEQKRLRVEMERKAQQEAAERARLLEQIRRQQRRARHSGGGDCIIC
ncbi:P-loop containing nucleoside triphosphate hydrolase protein [Cristinia sonorae]|uniref:P-loop containing nucleoside triphosphate hydrolase protein n=1 Tax=Cristinia sonorae TaxID=1940300 RepID=A0A8K0XSP1_9AGAR|nr:P-loop containing nucleoside triphosphate hydrolase protein [Cristinia sonorae]